MGKKFVLAMLSVFIVITACSTKIFSFGFPVDKFAPVYAVMGDKRVLVPDDEGRKIIDALRHNYDRGNSGKCPFDYNLAFEIGNYRYAVAWDGCYSVDMYTRDGRLIYSGGTFTDGGIYAGTYLRYFSDEELQEYFNN